MNIIIPILFIVAMIYSEVNKKKKENENMDLSDLMSFDDFTNKSPNPQSSIGNNASYSPPSRGRQKKRSKPPKLNLPPLPNEPSRGDKNRGKISKDMQWGNPKQQASSPLKDMSMKLSKEEILKSFIFSEVLRRYDIKRIYDRIPGVNKDD